MPPLTNTITNTTPPTRTLSESDLQDLLYSTSSNNDQHVDFLPLFQDLNHGGDGFEYSPCSPDTSSSSSETHTSSPISQYDNLQQQQQQQFSFMKSFVSLQFWRLRGSQVLTFFFFFFFFIIGTSNCSR
jgi:hypothetical protein